MRADSGFYTHGVVPACRKLKVRFSITIRMSSITTTGYEDRRFMRLKVRFSIVPSGCLEIWPESGGSRASGYTWSQQA